MIRVERSTYRILGVVRTGQSGDGSSLSHLQVLLPRRRSVQLGVSERASLHHGAAMLPTVVPGTRFRCRSIPTMATCLGVEARLRTRLPFELRPGRTWLSGLCPDHCKGRASP